MFGISGVQRAQPLTLKHWAGVFTVGALAIASPAHGNPARDTEQVVSQVCASPDPLVVVDQFDFQRPDWSVDGSGQPHTTHGQLVAAIAQLHGKNVIGIDMGSGSASPGRLAQSLKIMAEGIESGQLKPSALVLSVEFSISLSKYNEQFKYPVPITTHNVDRFRKELLTDVVTHNMEEGDTGFAPLLANIKRLQSLGVPIFTAAGNYGGFGLVNFLSLIPGVHTVGALDEHGKIAPYTNNSSLVTLWRTGNYLVRDLGNGQLDLTGDDKADLSGSDSIEQIKAQFEGKRVSDVVRPLPEKDKVLAEGLPVFLRFILLKNSMKPEFLYPAYDYAQAVGMPPGQTATWLRQGDYLYVNGTTTLLFRADRDGILHYDPANNHDPQQVDFLTGTSFAAPALCDGLLENPTAKGVIQ